MKEQLIGIDIYPNQARNRYLDHLIHPSFQRVNKRFVLPFENDDEEESRKQYYLPTVEKKYYSVMIDGKDFLDQPIKNDLKKHLTIFKKFQQFKEMSTQLVVY